MLYILLSENNFHLLPRYFVRGQTLAFNYGLLFLANNFSQGKELKYVRPADKIKLTGTRLLRRRGKDYKNKKHSRTFAQNWNIQKHFNLTKAN